MIETGVRVDELATLLRNDSNKWARVVKAKNIRPD